MNIIFGLAVAAIPPLLILGIAWIAERRSVRKLRRRFADFGGPADQHLVQVLRDALVPKR